jgi:ABC-2 type transport system ATP-binding protein
MPGVLFLDEPTTGLDPKARKSVWRMIRSLAGAGVTILLTTQYLEEADQLAARIAVIDHGKKIAEGTSRELKAATGSGFLHLNLVESEQLGEAKRLLEEKVGGNVQRGAAGQHCRSWWIRRKRPIGHWLRCSMQITSLLTFQWAHQASMRCSLP